MSRDGAENVHHSKHSSKYMYRLLQDCGTLHYMFFIILTANSDSPYNGINLMLSAIEV
jgi:hypothetical protein